jgi:phenylpropionate dioxygenase-like ring-hydroxylating dioxygenase large terminal subunit
LQPEKQIEIAKRFLAHIDRGTTDVVDGVYRNPVSSYTSEEQLARERELLFRRQPLLVGFSCQIPNAGDYLTDDFAPTPILVVRSSSGAARAFANVCRHRGSRIAEGFGRGVKCFVCPYHAWTYALDGSVAAIPDAYGFEGIDRSAYGLRELPLVERHGLVWVVPEPGAHLDLAEVVGDLDDELAAYEFGSYHYYTTRVIRRAMNWKLVVDTFGEAYHLKPLHRSTVAPIFYQNVAVCRSHGLSHSMVLARRSIDTLREEDQARWKLIPHAATVYVLFPNTVLTVQGDHVDVLRVYPDRDRVDRCVMYVDWYVSEAPSGDKAIAYWDKNVDLFLRTVNDEDFTIGEGIQRGFASGAQTHLTYGRYEAPLQYYHRALQRALRSNGAAGHGPRDGERA